MHNGVRYEISGHQINLVKRPTMIPVNPNGCIHNSDAYYMWELTIDGNKIRPINNQNFFNIRSEGFDSKDNAFMWAWQTLTNDVLLAQPVSLHKTMEECQVLS